MTPLFIILAVVVPSPPPPPPATATQQQCKYSIRETYDKYVCYTEQEYQQKLAAEQAQVEASRAELNKGVQWALAHWWKLLLGTLGAFVILMIIITVLEIINEKRHPEQYDSLGFKKDWY